MFSGQTRLSFLLDLFEEDLARHRRNLNNLVTVQRRYNSEQFNEVMRLEAELGEITANLMRLIESNEALQYTIYEDLCLRVFSKELYLALLQHLVMRRFFPASGHF